jgi:hypothetical protein
VLIVAPPKKLKKRDRKTKPRQKDDKAKQAKKQPHARRRHAQPVTQTSTPPPPAKTPAERTAELSAKILAEPESGGTWRDEILLEIAEIGLPEGLDAFAQLLPTDYDRHVHEHAWLFFLLHPLVVLDRLEQYFIDGRREAAIELLFWFEGSRANAAGPAIVGAYAALEQWYDATHIPSEGLVRTILLRRQTEMLVTELRDIFAKAWFRSTLPGINAFIEAMDALLVGIPTLAPRDIENLNAQIIRVHPIVITIDERISELQSQAYDFASGSSMREFLEIRIGKYDAALGAGRDFVTMEFIFGQAEASAGTMTEDYQYLGINRLQEQWHELSNVTGIPKPKTNHSGLFDDTQQLADNARKYYWQLAPRIVHLFDRHNAGEAIGAEELLGIERDLAIVAVLYAGYAHHASLYACWEQLEEIEPNVPGDFDDLQVKVVEFANDIWAMIMTAEYKPFLALIQSLDYVMLVESTIPDRVSDAQEKARWIMLGVMILAMFLGAGAALATRMLLINIGLTAGAAGVAAFAAEVIVFTITSDVAMHFAFGKPFDLSKLPADLFWNAVMFGALRFLGRVGEALFPAGQQLLQWAIMWGTRHAFGMASFAAVGAVIQKIRTGRWPEDVGAYLEETIGTYIILTTVSGGFTMARNSIMARKMEPGLKALVEKFERIDDLDIAINYRVQRLARGRTAGEQAAEEPRARTCRAHPRFSEGSRRGEIHRRR